MSGVTLLRMLDVLRVRRCGANAEVPPRSVPSAPPERAGSFSTRSARLSMQIEESKACSADLCRPESGARKEQQKATARRRTSHHSIYFFGRRGRLLLAWPSVGLRFAVRRLSSPWHHAFSSPLRSVRVSLEEK
eukprot:3667346-Pyramimonas_sp.AAC.2